MHNKITDERHLKNLNEIKELLDSLSLKPNDIDNIYYNIKKIIVDVLCCEGDVTGDSIIICEINREENHE